MARGSSRQRQQQQYPSPPYDEYGNEEDQGGYLTLRAKMYVLVILGLGAHIVSMLRSPKINNTLKNTITTIKVQVPALPQGVDPLEWNKGQQQGEGGGETASSETTTAEAPLPFQPSPYDYYAVPVRTELTLPDPILSLSPQRQKQRQKPQSTTNRTNTNTNNLLVLVMSARDNFERRQAIRDSWGKNYSNNILFVVGGPHDPHAVKDPTDIISPRLFHEQKMHQDLLDTLLPESYRALPYKLHYSFRWIYNQTHHNSTNTTGENSNNTNQASSFWNKFEWFLKVDDDVVVRMQRLQRLILQKYNPQHPIVVGNIVENTAKATSGKWAEDPHYEPAFYPPWPRGSTGYVLSKPVADYLGTASGLHYYQGEDAGLGIWLEQGHAAFRNTGTGSDLTWIHSPEFAFEMGCDQQYAVTGHDMKPPEIQRCFWDQGGDTIPEHKSRVYRHEAPVTLFTKVTSWETSLWEGNINDVGAADSTPWDDRR